LNRYGAEENRDPPRRESRSRFLVEQPPKGGFFSSLPKPRLIK